MRTSTEPSFLAHIQAADAADRAGQGQCPNCAAPHRPGELVCQECGLPFFTAGRTQQMEELGSEAPAGKGRVGEAFAAQQRPLTLLLFAHQQAITLPTRADLTLGRASPEPGAVQPDVDLTAYDAGRLGVSRRHLCITREDSLIYVADLGSRNGTYLNGQRLLTNQKRILRNGDELRLGHLVTRAVF